ncbi:T9SS type A sorting domain-containing protein [bacterium]|nr:T9SS type A sorting domain-containing protein [bacterium]
MNIGLGMLEKQLCMEATMYERTLSYYPKNGRWWFAFLFLGILSNNKISAAPITVNAPNSTYFIANEGQWEGDFQFKCEVGSTVYYVTPKGMTVDFREFRRYPKARNSRDPLAHLERHEERDSVTVRGHVVQIHYSGLPPFTGERQGSLGARGKHKLPHYSNYFFGRDSTKWRSRVSHYQNIIVPEVWPGIDVEYRADKLGVETVYHVNPGADPSQIQMEYLGLDAPLRVDAQGNLILPTSVGDIKEQAPFAFQQMSRTQQRVESRYRVVNDNLVMFELDGYDSTKELIVDPLLYGTYLGGGGVDECHVVCPAPDGGVYVAGGTDALSGFPTTPGAYDETGLFPGAREFVSHFNAQGEFLASTLFGEIQTSENRNTEGGVQDMVFDSGRNGLWMCGLAYPDWPLTHDAMDTVIQLGESFILRLSEDLTTLSYCSYLGGSQYDYNYGIEIDSLGRIYAAGETNSPDFPLSEDALFTEIRGGGESTLLIWDPNTHEIVFSTYFGGSGEGAPELVWDSYLTPEGHIWLIGETNSPDIPVTENSFQPSFNDSGEFQTNDAFFLLLTLNPASLEYCSYIGGSGFDHLFSLLEIDATVYLSGYTVSTDFPTSPDAFDSIGPQEAGDAPEGFVARLNWETGEYRGTYIGRDESEFIFGDGNWVGDDYVMIAGVTNSNDFPTTGDAYDRVLNNGFGQESDAFVLKLDRGLSAMLYGSFVGGSHSESYATGWVVNADSLWLVGTTTSVDFPVTPDAFQPNDNPLSSAFVIHFAIDTTEDTTSAADNRPFPSEFALSAYPNPFNSHTTLNFTLPKTGDVELRIVNILGQEVERLNLGRLTGGAHRHAFDASSLSTGLYFAILGVADERAVSKLLLLR